MSGALCSRELAAALRPVRIGRRIVCLEECDSTNAVALAAVRRDQAAADGLVVFAEHQVAGRGRLGRSWVAPRGAGLLMTAVIAADAAAAPRLMLAAGIAVRDAIAEVAGIDAALKWPNDVAVGGRKLAGILIESTGTAQGGYAHAVGIGVNCMQTAAHFPPEFRGRATSLEIESAHAVDRFALAVELLRQLDERLPAAVTAANAALAQAWRRRCGDIGRRAELEVDRKRFAGTVVDVDADHGLWMELDGGGRRRFHPLTTRTAAP